MKKNPNVPLYRVVYACIFCNILILWRWSQDEYALICVMFDHGMFKLISCWIFSKLYHLIGTCLNCCGWVGFTICILNFICQSTLFKTIIFRLFCHIFLHCGTLGSHINSSMKKHVSTLPNIWWVPATWLWSSII